MVEPARRQQPHAVERPPDEGQERRQKRHGGRDGDGGNDQAADPESADERKGHEEQQRQADCYRGPAEDHRAAGGRHRLHDRLVTRRPAPQLLPIAVDDEERVVDRDPEPDQRDEVREIRRELHEVGEDPDDPERRGDGHDREREREEEGERPEGEDQDEKGDRNRDQLTSGKVVGQYRVEVVLDRRLAGDVDLRPGEPGHGLAHLVGAPLRVRGLEVGDDLRDDDISGNGCDRDETAGRELLGGLLRRRPHLRHQRRGGPVGEGDDRERPGRALPELVFENLLGPAGVGAGEREPVGQKL